MTKKKLGIIIIITLVIIFGHSILSREQSSQESNFVLKIFEWIFGEGCVSEHFVRKLAHFSEFGLLGFELMFYFESYPMAVAHGLFSALVDESIQIFTGRGPSVVDVWIDFSGALCGALLTMFILSLVKKKKKV